jgi:hypothetical protein
VLRLALSRERFSYTGQYYAFSQITSPRPRSAALFDDFLMASGSPGSMPIAAHAGLEPILIPNAPGRLTALYCAPWRAEAEEQGSRFMFEYADSARRHHRVDEPDAFGPGYEHYRARAQTISQLVDGGQDRQTATANLLRSVAVIGTPDDCRSSSRTSPAGLRSRVHAQRRSEHRRMVGGAW